MEDLLKDDTYLDYFEDVLIGGDLIVAICCLRKDASLVTFEQELHLSTEFIHWWLTFTPCGIVPP
jgi:hypothetical protein